MTHWEFSHIPFDGELIDNRIVCQNCGWSWNLKDGGNDPYLCHKCNTDNSRFYTSNFEGKGKGVDSGAIIGGVTALAGLGTSILQAKASKQMSKSDLQKEVDTRCGKDKSRAWSKKKKSAYLSCKNSVLQQIDTDKQASKEEKQKAQDLLIKQSVEREKSQRNQTYIVIGIVAVVLGFVIYKKMNK